MLSKKSSNKKIAKKSSKKSSSHKTLEMKNIIKNTKIASAIFLGLFFSVQAPGYLNLSELSKKQDNQGTNSNAATTENNNMKQTSLPNAVNSDQNNNAQYDQHDEQQAGILISREESKQTGINNEVCFSPRNAKEIKNIQEYEKRLALLNKKVNETFTTNDDDTAESESDESTECYLSQQRKNSQTAGNNSQNNLSNHEETDEIQSQKQKPESEKNTPNSKSTSEEANHTYMHNNTVDISNNSSFINNQNIETETVNNTTHNSPEDNNAEQQKEHTQSSSSAKKASEKRSFIDIMKRDNIPMHAVKKHLTEYSISEILESLKFIREPYTLERFLALTSILDSIEEIKLIFNSVLLKEKDEQYPNIARLLPEIFHLMQDTTRHTVTGILKLKTKDSNGKSHYDYDSILKVLDSLSTTFSECFIKNGFSFGSNNDQDQKAYSQFLTKLSHKASDNSTFKQTLKKIIEENKSKKQLQQQKTMGQEKTYCCC